MDNWQPGDHSFDWRGRTWDLRVELGDKTTPYQKGPDLRLDIGFPGAENQGMYVPLPMPLSFLITDFYYHNEERLYPQDFPNKNLRGGQWFLDSCGHAVQHGWRSATAELAGDIKRKYGR